MVTGIKSFKEWFKGNEEQYTIIGGTACDILMTEDGLDFRATKDIDLVLIVEAVDKNFGIIFRKMLCRVSSADPQQFPHTLYIPGFELSMKIDIKIPVVTL